MCGMDCAASTRKGTLWLWAILIISLIGLTVPNTLDTCTTLTIFVLSLKSFSYSSIRSSPRSFIGITFRLIRFRSASSCQGTMLLWCSITETITSSPGLRNSSPKLDANKLMLSVVPLVNTISFIEPALMNFRTVSRLASCNSVAC